MDTMAYSMSSNSSGERNSGFGIRRRLSALASFPNPFSKTLSLSNAVPREALPETFMKGRKEIEELLKCMLELQRLPSRSSTHWAKLRGLRETAAGCVVRVASPKGFLCEEVRQYRESTDAADLLSITAERRLSDDFLKVTQVLKAYMTEIESVIESFSVVYSCSKRYDHYKTKCERLQIKYNNSKSKIDSTGNSKGNNKKLESNLAKKEEMRAKFQAAVAGSNAMINATLLKKDAFLQAIFYHFVLLDHDLSAPAASSIQYMASLASARMHSLNSLVIRNPEPKPIDIMPVDEENKHKSSGCSKSTRRKDSNKQMDDSNNDNTNELDDGHGNGDDYKVKERKKMVKEGSEKYDSEKEGDSAHNVVVQHSNYINGHINSTSQSTSNNVNVKKSKKRTKSVVATHRIE